VGHAGQLDRWGGEVQSLLDRRVLPFDGSAAQDFALIVAERRKLGRPISHADAQIAAIARSRGASVATRNTNDFEHCGVEIVDPWC
jgi:toxin FitB